MKAVDQSDGPPQPFFCRRLIEHQKKGSALPAEFWLGTGSEYSTILKQTHIENSETEHSLMSMDWVHVNAPLREGAGLD